MPILLFGGKSSRGDERGEWKRGGWKRGGIDRHGKLLGKDGLWRGEDWLGDGYRRGRVFGDGSSSDLGEQRTCGLIGTSKR